MFRGSFTALITPFKNGAVDESAFARLVEWQIAEGTHGLVPVGTTGESPTLSHDEHKRVVEICVETAKKRLPVSLGTFPTTGPLFVGLLVGTVLIVGALTYFPALSLGPIVEQLQLSAGQTVEAAS